MQISPKFTDENWRVLDFSVEDGWQKAVNVFEDRISGRFLNVIRLIEDYKWSGFAVLALDCMLIETLQQFREGVPETPPQKSKCYFIRFLTETSFGNYFNDDLAKKFYFQIRCGILHQTETKCSSLIRISNDIPLVSLTKDKVGLVINRKKFHAQLVSEFNNYVGQLRENKPPNKLLRENFKRKMDFICRMQSEVIYWGQLFFILPMVLI